MRFGTRQFSGERQKIEPRNLAENEAQLAIDCELTSSGIRAMYENAFVQRFDIEPKTIYNFDGQWLAWAKRVSVAESPVGVATRRIFWTGDGVPRQAEVRGYLLGKFYRMGIPTPAAPTRISVTGTPTEAASTAISTVYAVTFVNRWGEEGDKSLPSPEITFKLGQAVKLGNLGRDANEAILAEYDSVSAYRVYRVDEGETRFVGQGSITTNTFTENTANELGELFTTEDYVPPPEDMKGLHVMANGVALGFSGSTVYVSEPYQLNVWPHSFPVQSPIVAVSSFDNTAVVLTTGYPEVASIYDPQNISAATLTEREPCVSITSVVQGAGGVIYAAPSGLFYIGPGGGQMLTKDHFDEKQWQALSPETFHAAYRDGEYYGFHESPTAEGRCLILDTRETNAVIRQLSQYASATHVLRGTDDMFLVNGDMLERFQGGEKRITYRWKSKQHGPGNPIAQTSARALSHEFADESTLDALREAEVAIAAEREANALAIAARLDIGLANGIGGAINQDVIAGMGMWTVPGDGVAPLGVAINNGADVPRRDAPGVPTLTVTVHGDLQLVDETVIEDDEPYRLTYADRCRRWEYELAGSVDLDQFDMAGSESEMHDGS